MMQGSMFMQNLGLNKIPCKEKQKKIKWVYQLGWVYYSYGSIACTYSYADVFFFPSLHKICATPNFA